MTETIDWPKASEGGRVVGKQEIRTYWKRQWHEFDPHVEPIEVKVHQLVKSLTGDVLSAQKVSHTHTIADVVGQAILPAAGFQPATAPEECAVQETENSAAGIHNLKAVPGESPKPRADERSSRSGPASLRPVSEASPSAPTGPAVQPTATSHVEAPPSPPQDSTANSVTMTQIEKE